MSTKQELAAAWRDFERAITHPLFNRRSYISRLRCLADTNGYSLDFSQAIQGIVRPIIEDYGLQSVQLLDTSNPDTRTIAYLQGKIDGLAYLTRLAEKTLRPDPPRSVFRDDVGSAKELRPCTSLWRAASCQDGDPYLWDLEGLPVTAQCT